MPSTSQPTRLHLIRHGAVAAPWNERIYGDLDVPLSDLGQQQSRDVARSLRGCDPAAVVSSGLSRTVFLAELLAGQADTQARVDPRLKELNRGDWAGWDQAQVDAAEAGAWARFWAAGGVYPVPGGEPLGQLQARVDQALSDLGREFAGTVVLVVAHKWVLRAALCTTLGLPMESSGRLAVPHTGGVTLDWCPRAGYRLLRLSWAAIGDWAPDVRP